MSQPRRRRRRRRKSQGRSPQAREQPGQKQRSEQPAGTGRSRRRRRGRGRGGEQAASPKSSEDLVRNPDKSHPKTMTAPPDGTTLEEVIGELQSVWGVPQYPQEFRITMKIADERETRAERAVSMDDLPDEKSDGARPSLDTTTPRREKAPAAPRVGSAANGTSREKAPGRRRRGRRRRRGGTA